MDAAEIRKRKRPATVSLRLLLDGALRTEYDRLVAAAAVAERLAAKTNDRQVHIRRDELAAQVTELGEKMLDEQTTFVFSAIPRRDFNDLMADAQPPRPEDDDADLPFDSSKFVPALLSACAVEPKIDEEFAAEIYNEWSDGEVTALFNAAYRANKEVRDVPFSVAGIGTTRRSDQNSTTAPNEE